MKRATGYILLIAGLLFLVLVFGIFNKWMDRSYNAWAYANPPLTQTWEADATAGSTRLRLTLALKRDDISFFDYGERDTQDNHRTLSGQAMLCDSTGRRQSYTVAGVVSDRRARQTLLTFSPPAAELPGLRPERMRLSWNGTATLSGLAELAYALPQGGTRISSSDPATGHPILFQFHPATDPTCQAP